MTSAAPESTSDRDRAPWVAALPIAMERQRVGRRGWAIIGASVLAHLVVLSSLGLLTPRATYFIGRGAPPIALRLVRVARPMVRTVGPSSNDQRTANQAVASAPLRAHLAPPPVLPPSSPASVGQVSTPPGQSAASVQGSSTAPGPLPAAEGGRGVRALLRATIGCDYDSVVHLSEDEKTRCADRFAKQARSAPSFIATPAEKLAGYIDEARANERKQRYREGNLPTPIVACTGNGSNFGLGCLPADAIHSTKH